VITGRAHDRLNSAVAKIGNAASPVVWQSFPRAYGIDPQTRRRVQARSAFRVLPAYLGAGKLEVRTLSERLGMPLIRDDDGGVWCLGPEAMGHALTTARAPELVLPDYTGKQFPLTSLRGQKVLIVTRPSL